MLKPKNIASPHSIPPEIGYQSSVILGYLVHLAGGTIELPLATSEMAKFIEANYQYMDKENTPDGGIRLTMKAFETKKGDA